MGSRQNTKPRRGNAWRSCAQASRSLDLAFQFGLSILAGLGGGWWLDRRWGCFPLLALAGTLAGAAVGFYQLYRGLTDGGRDARHGTRLQASGDATASPGDAGADGGDGSPRQI